MLLERVLVGAVPQFEECRSCEVVDVAHLFSAQGRQLVAGVRGACAPLTGRYTQKGRDVKGYRNDAAKCYVNSVVDMISSAPAVLEYCYGVPPECSAPRNCGACAFRTFVTKDRTLEHIDLFKTTLGKLMLRQDPLKWSGDAPGDAVSFFVAFVHWLIQQELQWHVKGEEVAQPRVREQLTLLGRALIFLTVQSSGCDSCHSHIETPVVNRLLPIYPRKPRNAVAEMIAARFQDEVQACPKCQTQSLQFSSELITAPYTLVVQVVHRRNIVSAMHDFTQLSLATANQTVVNYSLSSVLCHDEGHYFVLRQLRGRWHLISNEDVAPLTAEQVNDVFLKGQAFLLMYAAVDPSACPTLETIQRTLRNVQTTAANPLVDLNSSVSEATVAATGIGGDQPLVFRVGWSEAKERTTAKKPRKTVEENLDDLKAIFAKR